MIEGAVLTLVSVPAVVGTTNLAKRVGVPDRAAPVVAVITAFVFVFGAAFAPGEIWQAVTQAVLLGLSACGLYDLVPSSGTSGAARRATTG